uniref:Uncharacterized protein n=1 Tax=viral metagenome TaxID=1070528 RepID=A0A6C0E3J2_9ZZZZ
MKNIVPTMNKRLNNQTTPEEFQLKQPPSPCITLVKARNEIRQS